METGLWIHREECEGLSLIPPHSDLSIAYVYANHEDLFLAYTMLVSLVFSLPFIFQTQGFLCSPSRPLHPNHSQDSCPLLSVSWEFASAMRLTRKSLSRYLNLLVFWYKKLSALIWDLFSALAHHCLPSSHYENSIPQKCFKLLLLFRSFI